jgi:hypothetical protein
MSHRIALLGTAFAVILSYCLLPSELFSSAQQEIKVRFLDPRSGKPLRKMWVSVIQYKNNPPKGPVSAEYVVSTQSVRTDRNGEVTAILHDPLPTYISIHSFDLWYSGSLIPVEDVLKSGVVLDYSRDGAPHGYWAGEQEHASMRSGSLLVLQCYKITNRTGSASCAEPVELTDLERHMLRTAKTLNKITTS